MKSIIGQKRTEKAEPCQSDIECMTGFFCKNKDCVAKKSEGSLCLSSKNDECECGKCVLDEDQYIHVCSSQNSCPNYGILYFIKKYLNHF